MKTRTQTPLTNDQIRQALKQYNQSLELWVAPHGYTKPVARTIRIFLRKLKDDVWTWNGQRAYGVKEGYELIEDGSVDVVYLVTKREKQ